MAIVAFGQQSAPSLSLALRQAEQQHKLVRLVFELNAAPPTRPGYAPMDPSDPEVVRALSPDFVLLTVKRGADKQADSLLDELNTVSYPLALYMDPRAVVIARSSGMSSSSSFYTRPAQMARELFASGKSLAAYRNRFDAGERSPNFLKSYILERQQLGFYSNAMLLEAYVSQLRVADADKFDEVLFIMEAGPVLNSRAYVFANYNKKVVDSLYKILPLSRRVAINNRIIVNSRKVAISTKDVSLAYSVASFASATNRTNPQAAQRANASNMLAYYRGVKDTTMLLNSLSSFIDRFYMNISVDSARRLADAQLDSIRANAQRNVANIRSAPVMPALPAGLTRVRIGAVEVSSTSGPYATFLNNSAFEVYESGTKTQRYIDRALAWVQRAIDLKPYSRYYDTRAHLLYRQGSIKEAMTNQETAIQLGIEEHVDQPSLDRFKAQLEKMRKRTL